MQLIFIVLMLFNFLSIFGQDDTQYYYAQFNNDDSTFNIYNGIRFNKTNAQRGKDAVNSVILFENAYVRMAKQYPGDYTNIDSHVSARYQLNEKTEDLAFEAMGLTRSSHFLIMTPDVQGLGFQEIVKIGSIAYVRQESEFGFGRYLDIKSEKVQISDKLIRVTGGAMRVREIVAVHIGNESGPFNKAKAIDTTLPSKVKSIMDSSLTFRSKFWKDRGITGPSINDWSTRLLTNTFQPVSVLLANGVSERRFLLLSSEIGKMTYSDVKYLDGQGNFLQPPVLNASLSQSHITHCYGIIRTDKSLELGDLLVCQIQFSDNSTGVSLFASDENGIYKEEFFWQYEMDKDR